MRNIFVVQAFVGSSDQNHNLFVVDNKGRLWQRTYGGTTAMSAGFMRVQLPEEPESGTVPPTKLEGE